MSLGRLLGAGHGAPIIVAGDRSETSPSNTSSSACKSCHRVSSAAPPSLLSSLSASQLGTETKGQSRPEGLTKESWSRDYVGQSHLKKCFTCPQGHVVLYSLSLLNLVFSVMEGF